MSNIISFIPRQAKETVPGRSSMVSPLEGHFEKGFMKIRRPGMCCCTHTEQIVIGLDLPLLHLSNSVNDHPCFGAHEGKEFSGHPDRACKGVRLLSTKNWNAGLPMTAARNVTKCHSCDVMSQGGNTADKPINTHALNNSICDLVEKLSEKGCDMASRDAQWHHPVYNDQPRMKEGSYTTGSSTSRDSKLVQFIEYQSTQHDQCRQQSMATDGHSPRGTNTKSRNTIMQSLPVEEMILSEKRLYEEDYSVDDTRNNQLRAVPVMCKICHNKEVDCVSLPCGDAKACTSCTTKLFNSGRPCDFCKQMVGTVHPMY